jgi:glyoxylase-like metal-dependent hydrolase (beta-lactamase superfamily II)
MTLQIETIPLGPLETNCYVLWDDDAPGLAWVVDVGMWSKPLVELLQAQGMDLKRILLTHGHGDHIGGVEYVKQVYPQAVLCCPEGDEEMLTSPELNLSATFLMGISSPQADEILRPGERLKLASLEWKVLDTAGHTPGGVSFYCASAGVVLTGDALFAGSVGRTDIPNGDAKLLIANIRENLLTLPGETRVYPGHGPATTIAAELAGNPYLR